MIHRPSPVARRLFSPTVGALLILGLMFAQGADAAWVKMQHGTVLEVQGFEIRDNGALLTLPNAGVLVLPTSNIDRILPAETSPSRVRGRAPGRALSVLQDPLAAPLFDPSQTLADMPYRLEIASTSRRLGVNPLWVAAIIEADTDFHEQAFSTHDGRGLMMVRPEIAESVGVEVDALFVPIHNIEAGTRYLQQVIERHPGDPVQALATYKSGGRPVGPWRHGLPDDPELRNFIFRFCSILDQLVTAP